MPHDPTVSTPRQRRSRRASRRHSQLRHPRPAAYGAQRGHWCSVRRSGQATSAAPWATRRAGPSPSSSCAPVAAVSDSSVPPATCSCRSRYSSRLTWPQPSRSGAASWSASTTCAVDDRFSSRIAKSANAKAGRVSGIRGSFSRRYGALGPSGRGDCFQRDIQRWLVPAGSGFRLAGSTLAFVLEGGLDGGERLPELGLDVTVLSGVDAHGQLRRPVGDEVDLELTAVLVRSGGSPPQDAVLVEYVDPALLRTGADRRHVDLLVNRLVRTASLRALRFGRPHRGPVQLRHPGQEVRQAVEVGEAVVDDVRRD